MASDETSLFLTPDEWRRTGAYAVDFAMLAAALAITYATVDPLNTIAALCGVHLAFKAYRISAHRVFGATIGKALFGMKLVAVRHGGSPSFLSVVVRDAIPVAFTCSILAALFATQHQMRDADWATALYTPYLFLTYAGLPTLLYALWMVVDASLIADGRSLHDDIARTRVVRRGASLRDKPALYPEHPAAET